MKLFRAFILFPLLLAGSADASFFSDECPKSTLTCGAGATFEPVFTPEGKLTEFMVKSVNAAKKSVKVLAHDFVSKELSMALIDVSRSNRDVEILLDKKDDNNGYSAATFFIN